MFFNGYKNIQRINIVIEKNVKKKSISYQIKNSDMTQTTQNLFFIMWYY